MAGIGAAYSQLRTPEDNIDKINLSMASIYADQAQEFRNRNEREKIRRENDIKQWEKDHELNFEDFKQSLTGSTTYDDVGRDFTLKAVDKYTEYNRLAEEALKKGDFNKKREYENKMLKIKGFASQVKDLTTAVANKKAMYQKMVDEGKMSGVDYNTWEKEMYAIDGKQFKIDFDKNDNPLVVGIKTLDDGTEEPFSIEYSKIMDDTWRPYSRTELLGKNGLITSVLDSLGSYEEQKQKGLYKTTSKLWTDTLSKGAKDRLLPLVQSDEVMADLMNQFDPSSTKRTGFTDEEKTSMVDKLSKLVESGYGQKYKEEFDKDKANYQLGMSKIAEDRRQADKKFAIEWYKANTDRQEANLKAEEFNFRKTQTKTGVEVGEGQPYTKNVQGFGNQTFVPFTLRTKAGKLQNIVIGRRTLENGRTEDVTVPSVSVEQNGQMIVFTDADGNEQRLTRKSNPQAFSLIESQLSTGEAPQRNSDPLGLGL